MNGQAEVGRQFIALAERISGQQLDAWLFVPGTPTFGVAAAATATAAATTATAGQTPPAAASLLRRLAKEASRLRR